MNNYDKINVPKYEEGKEVGYLCNMCGQYTTLNDSVSHRGWNLVCNRCYWKFKSILGSYDILLEIQEVGKANKEAEEIKRKKQHES